MVKRALVATSALAASVVIGVGVAPTASAHSGGGDGVVRTGSCSGSSDWKLKAKHDDASIQVEFEVDSSRVGQRWAVTLSDNGGRFFSGTRLTQAPSGSFSVERRTANRGGIDRIAARATNSATGETCSATVSV